MDRQIDRFKIFKKLGVAQWCKLIRHRSNEKSKNNNNSSNYQVFGLRPQTKIGHPRPLFRLFESFQTNITIFTTNKCEKMSIQYMLPGFELTTFGNRVSFHNHQTRAPTLLNVSFIEQSRPKDKVDYICMDGPYLDKYLICLEQD